VLAGIGAGLALLAAFVVVEARVRFPMFRLPLFRIRAFTFGVLSSFLAAVARGGLMFMLIIWLQGIWLPQHGYGFISTPLWAGIYMLPLTLGFLIAGPASGYLSDRYGARPFATGGMLAAAGSFLLLERLPINFPYPAFALILLLNGLAQGSFASPNRAGVMNSLPAADRGAGGGMNQTFPRLRCLTGATDPRPRVPRRSAPRAVVAGTTRPRSPARRTASATGHRRGTRSVRGLWQG
jgi:hypothetical protein